MVLALSNTLNDPTLLASPEILKCMQGPQIFVVRSGTGQAYLRNPPSDGQSKILQKTIMLKTGSEPSSLRLYELLFLTSGVACKDCGHMDIELQACDNAALNAHLKICLSHQSVLATAKQAQGC